MHAHTYQCILQTPTRQALQIGMQKLSLRLYPLPRDIANAEKLNLRFKIFQFCYCRLQQNFVMQLPQHCIAKPSSNI
jgi:hypothetical protein